MGIDIGKAKDALGDIRKGASLAKTVVGQAKTLGAMLKNPRLIPLHTKELAWVTIASKATGEKAQLVWTPAKVSVSDETSMQGYDIITRGEVQIPKGMKLKRVSWEGVLPGKRTYNSPSGQASDLLNDLAGGSLTEKLGGALGWLAPFKWEEPLATLGKLRRWQKSGDLLGLTITRTGIDLDVYLTSLEATHQGGAGDIAYRIQFVAAEPLKVGVKPADASQDGKSPELNERKEAPPADTATIKEGDTMWEMAERQYGDGSQWTKIQEANPGMDPYALPIGGTLKIPN